ncbi:MAG TPA: cytochrome c oxidase subunit 3 [Acidimicrobiales bacterium]|nr:cytochrome c oxidase subunit 3 [Acidimicrobiales bacterium]
MATTATDLEVFSAAPPSPPARPRVLLVGTALGASGAALTLLTLVALYARLRADVLARGEVWLPEGSNVQLTPGSMGMATLTLSLFTVAWIVQALHNDDRGHALMAFAVSLVLAAAYVNGAAYGWQQMGVGIASSPQALLIFAITGLHVAMTGVGMLFLAVMAFKAVGGQLTGRAAEGVSAAALYWFVTVATYSVVWYTITITK